MSSPLIIFALGLPLILAFASSALSLVHAFDEVFGDGGPLWVDFGDRAGLAPYSPLTLPLVPIVAVLLPGALVWLAFAGYLYESSLALSILVGIKMGDTAFSHQLPWLMGSSRPNPGFATSFIAAGEALLAPYLTDLPIEPIPVLIAGAVFAAVVPLLWLMGAVGRLAAGIARPRGTTRP